MGTTRTRLALGLPSLLLLLSFTPYVLGDLEPTVLRCCDMGTDHARKRQPCHSYRAPVSAIPPEQLSVCLSTIAVCCLNTHRKMKCEEGKMAAQAGSECRTIGQPGGEYHKGCCEACKLGIFSGSMNMGCMFRNFSFEYPWDETYRSCCMGAVTTTTAISYPNFVGQDERKMIPTPAVDNICDLLPGQLCAHICIPEDMSYRCACKEGFTLNADHKTCSQIDLPDRCKVNNPCDQICSDTGFSIECSCLKGYSLERDEKSCKDIDECELGIDICVPNNLRCKNEPGSYSCITSDGIVTKPLATAPQDADKFFLPYPDADDNTRCPPGYLYNLKQKVCNDIDECQINSEICGVNAVCHNTVGSYTCVQSSNNDMQDCPPGYQFNNTEKICVDINECEENLSNCNPFTEMCLNEDGTFTCRRRTQKLICPAGYKLGKTPGHCEDVDECAENIHSCNAEKETCRNTVGAYECDILCVTGFQYSRALRTCVDIDECAIGNNKCPTTCVNTIGSYKCSLSTRAVCPAGFKPTSNKESPCDDVDECAEGLDSCDKESEKCINEVGHYRCEILKSNNSNVFKPNILDNQQNCPSGFSYSDERRTCLDINECLTDLHNCSAENNEECVNIRGGFICRITLKCSPGYLFDRTTMKCEDVDECALKTSNCPGDCINTIGSYKCSDEMPTSCHQGYKFTGRRNDPCEDIDECEEKIDDCNHETEVCKNELGAYQCIPIPQISCSSGFRVHSALSKCIDIDECSEATSPLCGINQICVNTLGSYECQCNSGFQLEAGGGCVDINECQTNQHDCTSSQRCDNTVGSYQCIRYTSCGTGYTLNAQTGQCEDDDECLLGTDNCHILGPIFQCRNTPGSFRCERKRCNEKQILDHNGQCIDVECSRGYEPGNYGKCIDINECEKDNPCRRNQQCINTPGSYRCMNLLSCGRGFELNEAGTQCIDIDECARGLHQCSQMQTCHNRQGTYFCQCPPGHKLNSDQECEDIDECEQFGGQVCPSNSVCENNIGSFYCKCNDGFKPVQGEKSCSDIDECLERPGVCHQKCVNVWGSYRCACEPGYVLQNDGRTCQDIDECEEFKDRKLCIGFCVNEPGSYRCHCPNGYRLGSDGRTCQDINECTTGTACRGANEVCVNTLGGFQCPSIECPPGFSKDPSHRNRCKRDSMFCLNEDVACLHKPVSYSYNFITFVSNIIIPSSGHLDLFTMRGLTTQPANFFMNLTDVRAPHGITPADKQYFELRRGSSNQGIIALVHPIIGPQQIDLELVMELNPIGIYKSKAVAKLIIYVSEYEF